MTNTDTTIDFAPLLELRAEYDRIGADLIARIKAGDAEALAEGAEWVGREQIIVDELDAKLQTMYVDGLSAEPGYNTLCRASDGFGAVIHAIAPTGDLSTVVDNA